jgi:hypothetical protein
MMQLTDTDTDTDTFDDAADTLRFVRPDFDFEDVPTDPDATSIYDLRPTPVRYVGRARSPRCRRQIRDTHENVARLREALAEGWDIAPELALEERRLSALMTADRP